MTKPVLSRQSVALAALSAAIALAGCASTKSAPPQNEETPPAATHEAAAVNESLTLVSDPSQVCMVNNQFMGRTQIPVQVDGKTYYGCCAMCKARLAQDASTRTAIDPVSQVSVDKATAIIGKTPDGSALYFASRDHFDSYARRAQNR